MLYTCAAGTLTARLEVTLIVEAVAAATSVGSATKVVDGVGEVNRPRARVIFVGRQAWVEELAAASRVVAMLHPRLLVPPVASG